MFKIKWEISRYFDRFFVIGLDLNTDDSSQTKLFVLAKAIDGIEKNSDLKVSALVVPIVLINH